MIKTMQAHKTLLIVLCVSVFFTLLLTIIPLDYTLTAPGFNDNVSTFIQVPSTQESEGSFHTTSVIVLDRISMYQYALGNLLKKVDVEETPASYDFIDLRDLHLMDILMKDDSIATALIVGIREAGSPITYETNDAVYLVYNNLTPDTLKIGDYIISVNGSTDVNTILTETVCGDSADVVVLRNGEELEFTIYKNELGSSCFFGFYLIPFSEIIETSIDYTLKDTNTGGPSGGLMQTLYVYNQLTSFDYTLGLKVAGTGTLDVNGNVGYIGGVRQKIITAISNDIDIFFIPYLADDESDNYIEALATLEEFDTDMILVGVATLDDAITYLEGYGDSNE